ncbi:MAG: hypothetical protein U5L09_14465 [Bacteroidales bacterium]|nr:hypothetical protein [Bacteroidales bacterium]
MRSETSAIHTTDAFCTIETPEGPNIGLISSLCVYAKINKLGFIETPYLKIDHGKVIQNADPVYLSAEEEEKKIIAQANTILDEEGNFVKERVKTRYLADYPIVERDKVDLIDSAPNQIASIAASLIPSLATRRTLTGRWWGSDIDACRLPRLSIRKRRSGKVPGIRRQGRARLARAH